MASASLKRSRTAGSTKTKFTVSMWVKRSSVDAKYLMVNYTDDSNRGLIQFGGNNEFLFQSKYSNSNNAVLQTNRKFRDTSAWYHFVLIGDSTLATAGDRLKLYVNGVRETSFASETQISQNGLFYMNEATTNGFRVGEKGDGSDFFDGYLSHVIFLDGVAAAHTDFGETDATTGIWKPKTSPSVTYGTNGFFLKFDNSANMGLDSSGQGNNLTTTGSIIQGKDTPSNVFATINPLFVNDDGATNALTHGGNTYTSTTRGEWNNMTSTLGATTGKWYWEVKFTQLIDASTIYMASEGVASTDLAPANHNLGEGTRSGYGYGWLCGNRNTTSNTRYLKTVNGTATLTTDSNNTPVVAGDIVGVAWDATNGKLWFHKNGVYIDDLSGNVGNPSTAAYPYHTGMQTGILYTVWADNWQNASGTSLIKSYNFGNGCFGTTAVTSAENPDDGNGIFEYDVPAGYRALCTKSINATEYS